VAIWIRKGLAASALFDAFSRCQEDQDAGYRRASDRDGKAQGPVDKAYEDKKVIEKLKISVRTIHDEFAPG
jgi:hypothetical protein